MGGNPGHPKFAVCLASLVAECHPRANHTLRTLPPALSSEYSRLHDEGIWGTALALIGPLPGTEGDVEHAKQVASLPMRMGGLGLRSATHCAAAAYWASWADALHMVDQRNPAVAERVEEALLGQDVPQEECLAHLREASATLERQGFAEKPSWASGKRPSTRDVEGEPGEWHRGWQYWSSSVSDSDFRKTTMLHGCTAAHRAHLRSHSGRNAGAALALCPTTPEYTIPPHLFRTLLLERLRLPLQITEDRCEGCHTPLDALGQHHAACMRSGRVKKRAVPTERTVARIFREAGATVRMNAFLKDMNVNVSAEDSRN